MDKKVFEMLRKQTRYLREEKEPVYIGKDGNDYHDFESLREANKDWEKRMNPKKEWEAWSECDSELLNKVLRERAENGKTEI